MSGLGQGDPDPVAADLDGVGPDRPVRTDIAGPGGHVEGPSMQGAMDTAALEPSGTQGAAPMRTVVIDDVKPTLHVEQGEAAVAGLDGTAAPRWKAGDFGHLDNSA